MSILTMRNVQILEIKPFEHKSVVCSQCSEELKDIHTMEEHVWMARARHWPIYNEEEYKMRFPFSNEEHEGGQDEDITRLL